MTMESAKLDLHGLPLEILQLIGGHLDDSHRPSLYAFSLASKTCHRAAIPSMFHHLHLTIRCRETLQCDVNTLVSILSRTESARHVRCLSIKGSLRLDLEDSGGPRCSDTVKLRNDEKAMAWFKSTGVDEILGDEEPIDFAPHILHDEPIIESSSQEDREWAPIVSLVRTLPCLTKLVYDCWNQFPPSLLDALHKHHPQCKLYHHTFRLRSLLWDTPHPYEMAMATSPCLYSVKLRCARRDSNHDDDFNQEAMMELVTGLAPNLREVLVMNLMPERAFRYNSHRGTWQGLPGFVSGRTIGSLISLSLIGAVDLSLDLFRTWPMHTDFSSLRHLTIGGGHDCSIGINDEVMEWIVQNCSFPQLQTLRIRLIRDDLFVERPNYTNNAIALFRAFEPLNELSVSGSLEPKVLDAILYRHGRTLKKLSLCPSESAFSVSNGRTRWDMPMVFTKEHVLQIQAQCPALQELAIPVKRNKSNALEAEIYRSFGKMEHLQSLFITLDCSNWRVTRDRNLRDDLLFDENDRETCAALPFLKKGYLRETFMNCAVDETLARSIWETICQEKVGKQLESLKLWTTGGGQFGNSSGNADIPNVVNNLSRSWLIERVARDDKDIINVRELGLRAREARDQRLTDQYNMRRARLGKEVDVTDSESVGVFHRIWPRKEESKDWREDWSSLPLQV